jgi:hypothetical protein
VWAAGPQMRCAKISASHHELALGGRRDLSTWAVTLVPSRVEGHDDETPHL